MNDRSLMKYVASLVLASAVSASAQLTKAPDNRVSIRTNSMMYITNTVLQQNISIIDTNLVRLHRGVSSLSNSVISISNMVVMASNRAEAAYDLALAATSGSAFRQRTYIFTATSDVTLTSCTVGEYKFVASTQSLSRIQIGHLLGPSEIFNTNSVVTNVDLASGANLVYFSGSGGMRVSTNIDTTINVSCTGTLSHTVPLGFSRSRVTVTGSGGTGGSVDDVAYYIAGSGGGAGGTAIGYFSYPEGTVIPITIGIRPAVAATVVGGTNGNAGTVSSFGTAMTAYGGAAGNGLTLYEHGGKGGTAVGGALCIPGGSGEGYRVTSYASLGGGSFWGGGSSGAKASTPYGAGGSGWDKQEGSSHASQAGDGVVVIEYY